jgi:proteasome accessory factor C
MSNQSAPIQEVSRLLDLVPFLSTHSHISLKELAEEFGISEKAMASELTALSMCGLPGYTPYELIEIFFESGFVTINNHDALDIPRALTQLEVASLHSSINHR